MRIAILTPTLRLSGIYFWLDLIELLFELSKRNDVIFIQNDSSAPLDEKRENLAELALKWNADYLLWLDMDMRFGRDIFYRLKKWNKDIVSGIYIDRYGKLITKLKGQKKIPLYRLKTGKLIKIESTGFGCLLTNADVFRSLKKPWFEWKLGRPEDLDFCLKATKQGYKIYADPNTFLGHGFSERRKYWSLDDI